ncbi:YLR224W [Saccharomyces arboricola H-6]|uniref:YLR224W n=1 Tax=Saccharomyces arboricola (strain H-6 / AS 2.3317 / CBS 10644) TaxID=1160507 RepID=J8PKQ7_SACAR|nr:YLR224W [Saccharomyces arboricola H-6]
MNRSDRSLMDLPLEIHLSLLEHVPNELRAVNRYFYVLHNHSYREKSLAWISEDNDIWALIKGSLCLYIKSLDSLRQYARQIIKDTIEPGPDVPLCLTKYIADSWYIVYNALQYPGKIINNEWDKLSQNQDTSLVDTNNSFSNRPKERILMQSLTALPVDFWSRRKDEPTPVNVWFYVKNAHVARYIQKIITEIGICNYGPRQIVASAGYINELITSEGIYCINLGHLPRLYDEQIFEGTGTTHLPLELKTIDRTDSDVCINGDLVLLGYDFIPYQISKPWLLFRVENKSGIDTIFNYSECSFSYEFAWSLACLQSEERIEFPKDTISRHGSLYKPSKLIRNFVYKHPEQKQDLGQETALPNWNTPYLRR